MRFIFQAYAIAPAAFLVSGTVSWRRHSAHHYMKMTEEKLNFISGVDKSKPFSRVLLGGGCFWGVEKLVREEFGGMLRGTAVGFAGGQTKKPTYEEVCTGNTGHCEAVDVHFYDDQLPLEKVLRFFWSIHDPTTLNRQGNDVGTQYRSAIFLYSREHKEVAQRVREEMKKKWEPKKISTDIYGAGEWDGQFWPADRYHQLYLERNPGGYCNHRRRF